MIKLPVSLKQFMETKRPMRAILYLCFCALGFMYFDLKRSSENTSDILKEQLTQCKTETYMTRVEFNSKLDIFAKDLRRSDSLANTYIAMFNTLKSQGIIK